MRVTVIETVTLLPRQRKVSVHASMPNGTLLHHLASPLLRLAIFAIVARLHPVAACICVQLTFAASMAAMPALRSISSRLPYRPHATSAASILAGSSRMR